MQKQAPFLVPALTARGSGRSLVKKVPRSNLHAGSHNGPLAAPEADALPSAPRTSRDDASMFDGVDTTVIAHYVLPAQVRVWASRIRPHLAKISESSGGRYEASDMLAGLIAGRLQLWLALEGVSVLAVLVTEIATYPRLRAMRSIGLVGSRPRQWMGLLAAVEMAAHRHFGCTVMEAFHLPRLATLLPGYRTTRSFSEKVIA